MEQCVDYWFTVAARTHAGPSTFGERSANVSIVAPPEPPATVLLSPRDGAVDVTIAPPTPAPFCAFNYTVVTTAPAGHAPVPNVTSNATFTRGTLRVEGLTDGLLYGFAVTARHGFGASELTRYGTQMPCGA